MQMAYIFSCIQFISLLWILINAISLSPNKKMIKMFKKTKQEPNKISAYRNQFDFGLCFYKILYFHNIFQSRCSINPILRLTSLCYEK